MKNKLVSVSIVQTRPHFDEKYLHWLGMGMDMGMENSRLFQLDMGMSMGMYISSL